MSDRINFSSIIQELSDRTAKSTDECQQFVEELSEMIINEVLENDKASITNFGSFSKVEVSEREGINPANGQPMTIPAHTRVGFSPYKNLEEAVNAPFSHLEPSFIEDENEDEDQDTDETLHDDQKEESEKKPAEKKAGSVSVDKYRQNKLNIRNEEPSGPWSIIFTALLILVILFGIWWAFFRSENPSSQLQPTQETEELASEAPSPTAERDTEEQSPSSEMPEETQSEPEPEQPEADVPPVIPVEQASDIPENYTVIGGEWMYDIARNVYGNPELWALIYAANTDKMQRPDDIKPGITLTIPTLTGSPNNLSRSDSIMLSDAYRSVADKYQNTDQENKATAHLRQSNKYSVD